MIRKNIGNSIAHNNPNLSHLLISCSTVALSWIMMASTRASISAELPARNHTPAELSSTFLVTVGRRKTLTWSTMLATEAPVGNWRVTTVSA